MIIGIYLAEKKNKKIIDFFVQNAVLAPVYSRGIKNLSEIY